LHAVVPITAILQSISFDLIEAVSERQTLIRHFETERNDISDRFMAQLLIPINLNKLKQEDELHICDAYRADLREEFTLEVKRWKAR